MQNRYRIIEHTNPAGLRYYTIDIEEVWFFGIRFWRELKSYSTDGSWSTTRIFDTLEQAQTLLDGAQYEQRVVEQGTLWTRNSYTL